MSRNDGFINLIAQVYKDMEEKKKSQDGNILLLWSYKGSFTFVSLKPEAQVWIWIYLLLCLGS